jgi:DNA-binding transcriptional LysR family regulator
MNLRPRRFLPSIPQLLAFEAVMRARSTVAAASELKLTQSTVSRLVQTLEDQVGRPLFHRHRKRLIPTEAGEAYCLEVSRALNILQQASMALALNPTGGALSLATLPTFGTRWLAPRLGDFLSKHPEVSLNLVTRVPRFSLEAESFDAVIFYGTPDWPGAEHQKLFDEIHVACAAPELLDRHQVENFKDLDSLTLLYLENRPDAWRDWFRQQNANVVQGNGMMMDQFSMMIQAAIEGLGIALLPEYLARAEIATGRLRALDFAPVTAGGAYWLAWQKDKERCRPLLAFREWIADQLPG